MTAATMTFRLTGCDFPRTANEFLRRGEEFRGRFPDLSTSRAIQLDFQVESNYSPAAGDVRELGVIVPLLEKSPGNSHRIPFRVS
jgi:hypothetical protein